MLLGRWLDTAAVSSKRQAVGSIRLLFLPSGYRPLRLGMVAATADKIAQMNNVAEGAREIERERELDFEITIGWGKEKG